MLDMNAQMSACFSAGPSSNSAAPDLPSNVRLPRYPRSTFWIVEGFSIKLHFDENNGMEEKRHLDGILNRIMPRRGVNVPRVSKLILRIVDTATCFDCLRYFTRPERATCGHVLCHCCWLGRTSCPCCKEPLQRKFLKPDVPMQKATNTARHLVESFEQLFEVQLTDFIPMESSQGSSTSSENNLSSPPSESRQLAQDILCPVQIHAEASSRMSGKRVFPVSVPKCDWDKKETVQDTEAIPQIHGKASNSTCSKKERVAVSQEDRDKIETVQDTEAIPQIHGKASNSTCSKKERVAVSQEDWDKIETVQDTEAIPQIHGKASNSTCSKKERVAVSQEDWDKIETVQDTEAIPQLHGKASSSTCSKKERVAVSQEDWDKIETVQDTEAISQIHGKASNSTCSKKERVAVSQEDWDKIETVQDTEAIPQIHGKASNSTCSKKERVAVSREDWDKIETVQDTEAIPQIHGKASNSTCSKKERVAVSQEDWDKIETIQDTEAIPQLHGKASNSTCSKKERVAVSQKDWDKIETVQDTEAISQIHGKASNSTCSKKERVAVSQEDWDKIETVQDTEAISQIHGKASNSTCSKKERVAVSQKDWDKIETAPEIEQFEFITHDGNEVSNEQKINTEVSRGKSPTKSEAVATTSNNSTQRFNYKQKNQNENKQDHVEPVNDNDEMCVSVSQTRNMGKVRNPFTKRNTCQASTAYITFGNKQEQLQHKVYTTKRVQTYSEPTNIPENHIKQLNISKGAVHTNNQSENNNIIMVSQKYAVTKQQPDDSTRKCTPFAAVATSQFLVTERFEENLSDIMECEDEIMEFENVSSPKRPRRAEKDIPDNLNLDTIDILNSKSKGHIVQMLDISYPTTTADISVSTHKNSKSKTRKHAEKRSRELDDIEESISKRRRIQIPEISKTQKLAKKRSRELYDIAKSSRKRLKIQTPEKIIINDNKVSAQEQNKTSNYPEYNELIGLEFANIDAGIEQSQKQHTTDKKTTTQALNKTNKNTQNAKEKTQPADKYGQNMSSSVGNMLEKGNNHISDKIETIQDTEAIPQLHGKASNSTCSKKERVTVSQKDWDKIETVQDTEAISQIHGKASNSTCSKKERVAVSQEDWDKIETVQDTEAISQIHGKASNSTCSKKERVAVSQKDWDKIETAPEIEQFEFITHDGNEVSNEQKVNTEVSRGKSPTKSEAVATTSNNSTQRFNYKQKNQNENKQDHVEPVNDNDEMCVSVSQTRNIGKVRNPFTKRNTCQASTAYITFGNKQEQLQHKVYTTKRVQTYSEPTNIPENHIKQLNISKGAVHTNNQSENNNIIMVSQKYAVTKQQPDDSTRKCTPFAAVATSQFLVTERFEENLSDIMECEDEIMEFENVSSPKRPRRAEKDIPDNLNLDTIDILNSKSKGHIVQMLDISYPTTTADISVSTHKNSKSKTRKHAEKRSRELDDIEESISKRRRIQIPEISKTQKLAKKRSRELYDIAKSSRKRLKIQTPEKIIINDNKVSAQEQNKTSNYPEYNELIGLEFANIDAGIEQSQKQHTTDKKTTTQALNKTNKNTQNAKEKTQPADKYGQNMSSSVGNMLEKGNNHISVPETQQKIANLLTPGTYLELAGPGQDMISCKVEPDTQRQGNEEFVNLCSDEDVDLCTDEDVEEVVDLCTYEDDAEKDVEEIVQKNISTLKTKGDAWFTDTMQEGTYKMIVKTSENSSTPVSPDRRPLVDEDRIEKNRKTFCVVGSCLTLEDLINVKRLCLRRKWTYVQKYHPDVTHVVIGLDEDNRPKRSVKYMCALAAGKWIISNGWVQKCLEANTAVNEEPYEVLDKSSDPVTRRSRLANSRIFTGFTFCCLPPFSIIDLNSLEIMLQAAGARVVKEPHEVKVTMTSSEPCLLLCDPGHTKEDLCMNLARQGVVPVNYGWVVVCIGDYALHSLYDYLMCPAAVLPNQVQKWTPELTLQSDDTESDT